MKIHRFILAIALAVTACAQVTPPGTPVTVPNYAAMSVLSPSATRNFVHVLGASIPGDGGGGDYLWNSTSTATTNTAANGGPIAYPYNAAAGRWIRHTSNLPELKGARFSGTSMLQSGGVFQILSGATLEILSGGTLTADKITISGTPTDNTDAATVGLVTQLTTISVAVTGTAIVNTKSALIGTGVSTTLARQGYVRNSTSGDGAAGMWVWDPTSTATESPVCVKSSNLNSGAAGRWLKL